MPTTYHIKGLVGAVGSNFTVGATVSWSSLSHGTGSVTANLSDGSYTITGLAADTYTVTPTLAGYTFSPSSATVVITSANQTQNFNCTFFAVPIQTFRWTTTAVDTAQRANENPLNPANWEVSTWPPGPGGGAAPIAIVSDRFVGTTNGNSCAEYWFNGTWPSTGQFQQCTCNAFEANQNGEVFLAVFTTALFYPCYETSVVKQGTQALIELNVTTGISGGEFAGYTIAQIAQTLVGNDVIRIEVVPGYQAVYWNGVCVITASDTGYAALSGQPMFDIEDYNTVGANQFSYWSAGVLTASASPFFGMGLGL